MWKEVPQASWISQLHDSWIRLIPVILKQKIDLQCDSNSAIISHNVRKSANLLKIIEHLLDVFTNIFMNSATLIFRGWKVFAQFPNTSPSGKRVVFDDLFPWTIFRISVKNVTLGTSEWTRVPPWKCAKVISRRFLESTPLSPYKCRVGTVTSFHRSISFFESFKHFRGRTFRRRTSKVQQFLLFPKVLSCSFFYVFVISHLFRIFCFLVS
jgi:hypothetical protein